ncbi:MBL fold metallo-hydrolase [Methanocella arvoryzae]|nr:MBL fold metallo-hydrolase [Methanocella arvoryzae]
MARHHTLNLPGSARATDEPGSIFFVGTATTIIRNNGFTILTDPNFVHAGDHVHLGYGLTAERLTNPAVEIERLPEIDFCLLSHMHGDHWDDVATEKLRKDIPVVTTPEAASVLKDKGFTNTRPLDTWDQITVNKGGVWARITSLPGKHGPPVLDIALPEVMGSMLEWGKGNAVSGPRIYISGDTLVFDDLKEIPKRYHDIDLALFHLGGTRIMGILVTMDAEQGIEAIRIIKPGHSIPIHYNDYDVFKSPLEDFQKAVKEAGLESRVTYLKHGDTFTFDRLPRKEVPLSR